MKVEQDKIFAVITITIETQDELDQLAALCNLTPILESLPLVGDIQEGIETIPRDHSGAHFNKLISEWKGNQLMTAPCLPTKSES